MVPLQLHRRIPLIRRPFWQRDQAIAERDRAVAQLAQANAERDKVLREWTEALNASRQGWEPKNRDQSFTLPPEFRAISIAGHEGKTFHIVVEGISPPSYDRWVIDTKYYSNIARLLVQILRGRGTLIDLGANIGTIGVPVAATGSRVIAVEMLPRNTMKLSLSVLLNRFVHFRIVQAAVTDHDGFIGYTGDEAWAQVSKEKTALQAVGLRLDTILDLIQLDSPCFLQGPVVMKIDIEGHELAALRGAGRFFAEHRPIFVFESIQVASDHPETAVTLKEFVSRAGYLLYILRGTVLSPHHADTLQISPISDILAMPHEVDSTKFELLANYEIRPLSPQEELEWLEEVRVGNEQFADHVAAVTADRFGSA